MKRSLTVVLALASGLGLCANAQTGTAAPSTTKIAVIAFQACVAQTNEGQRNIADIQKKYEPKQAQLKALSDEVDGLQKQLQSQGDKLSEQERNTRVRSLDEKQKTLQRDAEDARSAYQTDMDEMFRNLAQKVYTVLNTYAEQNGYTVVLDEGQQNGSVLWVNQAADITKAVIDAYNTKSGIPAPVPSAPTPTTRTTKPAASAPKK